ncbi:glycosyltransferase family 9 protein [Nannocystis pusilla]|uniref:glycosyltransferase family 9 protein n=1 Tax=Nannocystis pusilla TaxID=889268 RepID=UPI003BF2FB56
MSWSSARRVLCVRLDTVGDVLMTTPALRALKEGHAQRHLTLLTSSPGAVVGRLVPEVDDVWTYDAAWLKASPARRDASLDRGVIDRLRAGRFDAAVVFTVYSQNPLPAALLTWLADIPLRLAHCRENPYQLLTDWIPETEPERGVRHEVTRQLDLVAAVGLRPSHHRLSLRPCPEDHLAAEAELRPLRLGRRWAVVHPGATASSRRYPPAAFAVVARALVRDHGVGLVFTGAGDEVPLVEQIRGAAGVPTHSLAGRLSLGALAAVIARAGLLISNNTGPAHVAAAVGTPVVDLYALTNPQHTPWAVPARVLSHPVPCAPCYRSTCPEGHHLCLRGVSPATVVAAALELLRPDAREAPTAAPVPLALT